MKSDEIVSAGSIPLLLDEHSAASSAVAAIAAASNRASATLRAASCQNRPGGVSMLASETATERQVCYQRQKRTCIPAAAIVSPPAAAELDAVRLAEIVRSRASFSSEVGGIQLLLVVLSGAAPKSDEDDDVVLSASRCISLADFSRAGSITLRTAAPVRCWLTYTDPGIPRLIERFLRRSSRRRVRSTSRRLRSSSS